MEGFPNNREQAQNILANGIIPKHTIILNGIDSMLIERAAGKRVDSKTGEIYHTTFGNYIKYNAIIYFMKYFIALS